ncbi:hypothetical protein SprV_0602117600 [Sparganum proliferum]
MLVRLLDDSYVVLYSQASGELSFPDDKLDLSSPASACHRYFRIMRRSPVRHRLRSILITGLSRGRSFFTFGWDAQEPTTL